MIIDLTRMKGKGQVAARKQKTQIVQKHYFRELAGSEVD